MGQRHNAPTFPIGRYAFRMKARAPGSCANLGPGFDTLAVAISLYAEVEIERASSLQITASGEGAHLPRDGTHLVARVAQEVLGHDRIAVRVHSEIPIARGLGSSSALTLATAAALGVDDPLAFTMQRDGHADNAAAAFVGGLVTATCVEGQPIATSLFLDPDITFVIAVPNFELSTARAREVLPESYTRADVTFNLGRLGWLIASLADVDNFGRQTTEDRIHQPARMALFPESTAIMQAMNDAGALGACWSGAGPTVLGIVTSGDLATNVVEAAQCVLNRLPSGGSASVIVPDMCGLQVE